MRAACRIVGLSPSGRPRVHILGPCGRSFRGNRPGFQIAARAKGNAGVCRNEDPNMGIGGILLIHKMNAACILPTRPSENGELRHKTSLIKSVQSRCSTLVLDSAVDARIAAARCAGVI